MQQKKTTPDPAAQGFCRDCGVRHLLPEGPARQHGHALMDLLARHQRIDLDADPGEADPRLETAGLFGEARGKMFGVMVCRAGDGAVRVLRAFSGQYNGVWEVAGWAPPLFPVATFNRLYADAEPRIKEMGGLLQSTGENREARSDLVCRRRELSRRWMRDIHRLYTLTNFRGEQRPLTAAFAANGGIPTGTGDCCAPKLINQAVREQLLPLGMAEFYWGRENRSQTRQHGRFYPSCASKCAPILGFMLCGLDDGLTRAGHN